MNSPDFANRFNIHFMLNDLALTDLLNVNSQLVKMGSEIDFSLNHVPHITIIMGEITSEPNFVNIKSELQILSKEIHPFTIDLLRPYAKEPSKKFIFIDAEPEFMIREVKNLIYERLKQWITLDFHGGPNNHPHVTIGYIENTRDIQKKIKTIAWNPINANIYQIGLSRASKRGTCLPELEKYNIG